MAGITGEERARERRRGRDILIQNIKSQFVVVVVVIVIIIIIFIP